MEATILWIKISVLFYFSLEKFVGENFLLNGKLQRGMGIIFSIFLMFVYNRTLQYIANIILGFFNYLSTFNLTYLLKKKNW